MNKNRRLAILAIIVLFIVVVSGSLVFKSGPPTITIGSAYQIPQLIGSSAVSYGGTLMGTTNARSLISYDYRSGKATLLAPDSVPSSLAAINSLSFSTNKQYAVFQQSNANQGSLLYNQLQQLGLSPAGNYWWLFNALTMSYQPLPQTVVLAKFSGNSLYGLTSSGTQQSIATFDLGSLAVAKSIATTGISNFFVSAYGYVLETPTNTVSITRDGIVNQVLAKATNIIGLSQDGTVAIGAQNQGSDQQLITIALQNQSVRRVDDNLAGLPVWSASNGIALYAKGTSTASPNGLHFYTYSLATSKRALWSIPLAKQTILTPDAILGTTTAIFSDGSNNYYLMGQQLAAIKFPASSYNESVSSSSGAAIRSDDSTKALSVTLDPGAEAAEQQTTYQTLQQGGYNPNLLPILFTETSPAGDGE